MTLCPVSVSLQTQEISVSFNWRSSTWIPLNCHWNVKMWNLLMRNLIILPENSSAARHLLSSTRKNETTNSCRRFLPLPINCFLKISSANKLSLRRGSATDGDFSLCSRPKPLQTPKLNWVSLTARCYIPKAFRSVRQNKYKKNAPCCTSHL